MWDQCDFPKYPNAHATKWVKYPEPPNPPPADIIEQLTTDKLDDIVAWFHNALPDWQYSDQSREVWPPTWEFIKPNTNASVRVMITNTYPLTIEYMC
jgi:hypothetical protein